MPGLAGRDHVTTSNGSKSLLKKLSKIANATNVIPKVELDLGTMTSEDSGTPVIG